MIASPLVAGAVTPEDLLVTVEPGGYIQIDGRAFQDPPPDRLDTFAVRRARLDIDGNWGDELTFRLGAEFGDEADGEIYDAYVDWHAVPVGSVRVGKFKPPIGLERLQRNPRLLLLERSLVDNLIPNRDVGVAWQASGRLEAALGVFNQAADRRRDNEDVDNRKVFVARLFGSPSSAVRWLGCRSGWLATTALPGTRQRSRQARPAVAAPCSAMQRTPCATAPRRESHPSFTGSKDPSAYSVNRSCQSSN
jgi:hypothetical protein